VYFWTIGLVCNFELNLMPLKLDDESRQKPVVTDFELESLLELQHLFHQLPQVLEKGYVQVDSKESRKQIFCDWTMATFLIRSYEVYALIHVSLMVADGKLELSCLNSKLVY